jgi:hypothetical protein
MNCYNHEDKSSVGICKACGKGLCPECVTDMGHGLACKDEHEEMVETYNFIIEKNNKVYSEANKNILIGPIFLLFMGIVFIWSGIISRQGLPNMAFIMGIGFIVFSIVIFIKNRELFRKKH